jgi:lipopolysaccharide transport system ATP-binding protein
MNDVVIRSERLGKLYEAGERRGLTDLRERFSAVVGAGFRRRPVLLDRKVWALKDVSLEIRRGDVVGIMGHNGSGKTTLMKILSRISEPTVGSAWLRGRVGTLLDVGAGLHGELTGRENIYLNAATHGMQQRQIRNRFDEIVAFAEMETFIDRPLKYFSTGMCVRLAFTIAAFLDSSVLLVDEVLAQADPAFQSKCLEKMTRSAAQGQVVMFVSHDLDCIRKFCTRGLVFRGGRVVNDGPAGLVADRFKAQCGAPVLHERQEESVLARVASE